MWAPNLPALCRCFYSAYQKVYNPACSNTSVSSNQHTPRPQRKALSFSTSMSAPGYHHNNQSSEIHRRTSTSSSPLWTYEGTPYGSYKRRRVSNPTLVSTYIVRSFTLTPLHSTRNDRPHSSSDGRPRAPPADVPQYAYSSVRIIYT